MPSIYVILSAVIIAPLFEELIFRGFIFKYLKKKYSFLLSAIISSVFFSVIHLNPTRMLSVFVFGIICCFLYDRTKNIFFPILFHIVFNISSLILTKYFINYGSEEINTIYGENTLFLTLVNGIIFILCLGSLTKLIKVKF
ncbi:CPBP family intramembrane glutamic endopeptidase [Cellulophaga omnivescoria]|uniref:CPBP family intramembrane glutamic endopeptidase n=1 Tax=Cellulophaga omnivescoria TaxID=1888890 RepID=UPI0009876357